MVPSIYPQCLTGSSQSPTTARPTTAGRFNPASPPSRAPSPRPSPRHRRDRPPPGLRPYRHRRPRPRPGRLCLSRLAHSRHPISSAPSTASSPPASGSSPSKKLPQTSTPATAPAARPTSTASPPSPSAPPTLAPFVWNCTWPLDLAAMQQGCLTRHRHPRLHLLRRHRSRPRQSHSLR